MNTKEKSDMKKNYINNMIKNMPVLRAATSMTQAQLAEKVGVSRQTIVAIETRKRPLSWYVYLAIVCVFLQYEDSKKLFENLDLFDRKFLISIE